MRDRATLDFIRDRVIQDIRARPSVRPYLGEGEAVDPERRARATEYQRRRRAEMRRRRDEGVAV